MPTNPQEHHPQRHCLKFRSLREAYAILRLEPDAPVPDWARRPSSLQSRAARRSFPWSVQPKPFPFSLTGVLLSFIQPLSDRGIPIFAISTYDTDYVLIQEEFAGKAITALQQAGHELCNPDKS